MGFNIVDGFLIEYIEEPGVTEVVIPESVTRICQRAFSRCASLISVTIPNGINYHKIRNIQRLLKTGQCDYPSSVISIGVGAYHIEKLIDDQITYE